MKKVLALLAVIAICTVTIIPSLVYGQNSGQNPARRASDAAQPAEATDGRYIIKFKLGFYSAAQVRAAGGQVGRELPDLDAIAAWLPQRALLALHNNPNVEFIEVDPRRYPMQTNPPWSDITSGGETLPYGIQMVQADQVSDANAGNRKVCIIDSGYYFSHEDLPSGTNVTGDSDPGGAGDWFKDGSGHGTHVAGTIAAIGANSKGVVGVLPGNTIKLHIVRVFGDGGTWAYSSDLAAALGKCRNAGANVVSMSLGGSFKSVTEQQAFDNAYSAGVLSIAAAGNAGNTRTSYPAGYGSVVSVAAVDNTETVATFSQKNSDVEIAAPGVAVRSTVPYKETNTLTVGTTTYSGNHIEFAARSENGVSGDKADGGLCDTTNFGWSGRVVLCQRGTISFFDKVRNVQNSGGGAAVIYNNVSGGFFGTLGDGNSSTIPAISLSMEDGQAALAQVDTFSTVVSKNEQPASGYDSYDGTSMATPHVSAVAALVWSYNTSLTNQQIRDALNATAKDKGSAGRDTSYGYGIVRAKAALDSLGGGGTTNNPPTANFNFTTSGLTANFTDASTDTDGTVAAWSWNFGDGATSTAQNPSRTYAAAGTYTVTLTVTDNDGATGSTSKSVTVSSSSGGSISLTATGYKVKGSQNADLSWSGATSTNMDVYRSGSKITTTGNDGFYTDNINKKGGGTYTYKVCEAGTSTCSNEATVTF